MIGRQFGRLLVTGKAPSVQRIRHGAYAMWTCRCDCGTVKSVRGSHLRSLVTTSCGCVAVERIANRSRTHGKTQTPEYRTWASIKRRCCNPNQAAYPEYGGRGILICERWSNSFEAFLDDMGPKPTPKHTIDRIDNMRGYDQDNCRWATMKEQRYNQVIGRLHPMGECRSVVEAAEHYGISLRLLYSRLNKGWAEHRALTTPPRQPRSSLAQNTRSS